MKAVPATPAGGPSSLVPPVSPTLLLREPDSPKAVACVMDALSLRDNPDRLVNALQDQRVVQRHLICRKTLRQFRSDAMRTWRPLRLDRSTRCKHLRPSASNVTTPST
jgi:hypothetical protein